MSYISRIHWLPIAIAVSLVTVAVFAVVAYRNTLRDLESEVQVAHAYEVRETANALLAGMRDAETGQRGFLITGNAAFLEPYHAGVEKAKNEFLKLRKLATKDDRLQSLVDHLNNAYSIQQVHLKQTIDLRSQTSDVRITDEVIALVQSGVGKEAMDNARRVTADILTLENQRLESSDSETRYLSTMSRSSILVGNLLAGAMLVIVGIAAWVDRMKRDRAEVALVKQQEELQGIVDSSYEGILTYGDDLLIRLMNPAAATIFGTCRESSLGRSLLDFVPESVREAIRSRHSAFITSDETLSEFTDTPLLRSDGSAFFAEGSAVRTISNSDQFTTVKFRDLTESKVNAASQREHAAILEQMSDAMLVCDMDGRIASCNDSALKLLGFGTESADSIIGKNIVGVLKADPEQWINEQTTLLETGLVVSQRSWLTPSGSEMFLEQRRSLIRAADGEPTGKLVFLIDISDRVRQEVNERRAQRLESIGTLAGGIAHDLNNVLTPIMVSVDLLTRGSKSPERLLQNISTSADRGSRMIKKLLAFAGGDRPERVPINLRMVLDEVRELLSHTLQRSIELRFAILNDLKLIDGDSTELSQVVMNLALNARDAMPDGGTLEIEASNFVVDSSRAKSSDVLKVGSHVLLSVTDTGEGIPHEIIDRIYDPFFTTKPQGKGTGLGLATTLGIVRSYGGDMSVYSEPGVGTKFSIYLPCSKSLTPVESAKDVPQQSLDGNGEGILIVDDEILILESARETLESSHYRVFAASRGSEAIEIFKKQQSQIKLIVLDMMMPGMDGFQTKDALRQLDPAVRIVGSSGLRRPHQDGQRWQDISGFLAKPYTAEQLLQVVRTALNSDSTTTNCIYTD